MKELILPIRYNTDGISFEESMMNYNAIKQGYTYPLDSMTLTTDNYDKFVDNLRDFDKTLEVIDFSESQRIISRHIIGEEFVVYVSGSNKVLFLTAMCSSLDIVKDIFDIYKEYHLSDDDVIITMTTYFNSGGHMTSSDRVLAKDDINSISTMYYPYIDTSLMFKQFFSLQENILILTGAPGIGKSKLATAILKYASDNDHYLPYDKVKDFDADTNYVSVAYVKSTKVLADDQFWRDLEMSYYDFVIMDDLDFFLTKRDAEVNTSDDIDKNQFLNQFLSFTDGMEKNKTKFIITTNQPFEDLDMALLRKGRLFDILELRSLKRKEALDIWLDNNLTEGEFHAAFSSELVLPADLGSEISRRTNDKVDDLGDYLKEPGISKIQRAKQVKRVGV